MGANRESAVIITALAVAWLAAPPAATAQRRVAVVNAAADQGPGSEAAARVRAALERADALAPLAAGELARALEEPLPEVLPEQRAVAEAAALLEQGASLLFFEPRRARTALGRAEELLLAAPPGPEVHDLLVRVNLAVGLVHLEEENRGLALAAFEMVRRLRPDHPELDPGRYKPEAVAAFAEAGKRAAAAPAARAEVSATFYGVTIYLNGTPVGDAPLVVELPPGPHYLVAYGPEYTPAGRRVEVVAGDAIAENLPLHRISAEERALRLRAELVRGGDLLEGLRAAAALAGVDAAVVVTSDPEGGGVRAAVFDAGRDRLSYFRAADEDVAKVLGLLAPTPRPELPPDFFPGTPPQQRSWYETPLGIAGIATGFSTLVVAGVLGVLAAFQDRTPLKRTVPDIDWRMR